MVNRKLDNEIVQKPLIISSDAINKAFDNMRTDDRTLSFRDDRPDNWIYLDDWYYFKQVKNIGQLLNELIGQWIAGKLKADSIAYKCVARLGSPGYEHFGLLSKNFKDLRTYHPSFFELDESPIGMESLELLRQYFKKEEDFRKFVVQVLKMFCIDYYMNQVDRTDPNVYLVRRSRSILLGKLFDYSEAFDLSKTKCYFYNYPYNKDWESNDSYLYGSCLITMELPSALYKETLKKFPEFGKCLNLLANLDLNECLNYIAKKYHLNIPEEVRDYYLSYAEKKEEQIRKII